MGLPVVSVLDESKKDKTQKRAAIDWSREGPRTGITQQMAQERLVTLNSEIKDIEKEQKAKRDAWVAADQYRHEAADPKTRPNYDPPPNKKPLRADPTWTRPAVEAKTENLYIDCLLDAVLADPTKAIGFDGDDPGLCKLDTSATTTLTGVTQSIRQYSVLTGNPFALLAEVDMMEENKSETSTTPRMLAAHLDNPVDCSRTLSWRIKDQATQEIQTKRVYATLASGQRDKVKEIVLQESRAAALDIQVQGSDKSEIGNTSSSSSTQPSDIKTAAVKPGSLYTPNARRSKLLKPSIQSVGMRTLPLSRVRVVVTEEPKDTEVAGSR
ncbi:MAG: hypothetical protein J3R72DRAFT_495540 [Linnemannia gamsii]|nr:MAG: hypothetical protein J3R72DRAFT_495540 [Linnemannia gamsii]